MPVFMRESRLSSLLFSATRCFLQQVQVPRRHRTWPAIWTDNHMDRASFCQYHVATLDAVREFHNTALRASEFGLDDEFVFVSGGREIATCSFADSKKCLLFALQISIAEATLPAKVASPDFHPDQIVRIVSH